jgi:Uma2 family endonuclease
MPVSFAVDEHPIISVPDQATESIDSFREWAGDNDLPEKARVFFHRGEVWVYMGKEQLYTHVLLKTEIVSVLYQLAKRNRIGDMFSDGVLLTNEMADLSGNPDAVFVSKEAIEAGRVTLIEGKDGGLVELLGSPDMVLEVVSTKSVKKDNQTLFDAYHEAGISEYWLVDARGTGVEFTIYKHAAKKYIATRVQTGGWQKSNVFGKTFRVTRGIGATGNPAFTLEVK